MIWTDIIWYDIIYYIKNIFKKTKILIYLIVRILRVSQDLRIKIFFSLDCMFVIFPFPEYVLYLYQLFHICCFICMCDLHIYFYIYNIHTTW